MQATRCLDFPAFNSSLGCGARYFPTSYGESCGAHKEPYNTDCTPTCYKYMSQAVSAPRLDPLTYRFFLIKIS